MIIQVTWVLFMMEEYCGPIWAESINAPLTHHWQQHFSR